MARPNRQGSLSGRIAELFSKHCSKFANLPELVEALHPNTVSQLDTLLQGAGVASNQLVEALRFAAAPMAREDNGQLEAQALGWKKAPLQLKKHSSLKELGEDTSTFSPQEIYGLAQLFWRRRPSLEAGAIRGLTPAAQGEYYIIVWKSEGERGFEYRSQAENFDAKTAWMAVVGACGRNLQRLKGLVEYAHQHTTELAQALKPAVRRYFRVHNRQLLSDTMFDPSIGAAKDARSRYGDAAASRAPLPEIDLDDPDALAALPVKDLGRLLLPLRSWQLASLYGGSEALDTKLAETLDHVNFPDFSQWIPPGGDPPTLIPLRWVERLISYLSLEDARSLIQALMYSSRRLNAGVSQPKLAMWEGMVKRYFPETCDFALQDPDEWHAVFKIHWQQQFVSNAIHQCGQAELKEILTARGQEGLPLVYELWVAQRWDGVGNPPEEWDSALRTLVIEGLWEHLLTIGARLASRTRHAWWFTVGQRIRPLQVNDVVIRCDPQDYPVLKEGIRSRDDDERDKVVQIAATCFAAGQGLSRLDPDVSSLQRQIAGLRKDFADIQPVVDQLDQEHDLIRADLQLKADQQRAMKLFATHPNLQACYHATQVKLEEVFISAKAAAGGHTKAAEGAIGAKATEVEFFGEFIDFIPFSGALVKAATESLKALDEAQQTNLARNLSRKITTAEMLKQVEEMARWLTLTFEPQLRGLATTAEAKEARGNKSRATHKIKKRLTYAQRLAPAESFAEFGVFCLFNRLRAEARGKLPLENQPHSEIFVDVISSMRPRKQKTEGSDKGQRNTDKALQKVKNTQVRLASRDKVSLRDLYTRVGVQDENGVQHHHPKEYDERFNYCNGTLEMAKRRGLLRETAAAAESDDNAASAAPAESDDNTAATSTEPRRRKGIGGKVKRLEARLRRKNPDSTS